MKKTKTRKKPKQYNCIKILLENEGLTQAWLAEKLKMNYVSVTQYCNQIRQPSIAKLYDIAKIMKVTPADLLVF